jgi:putative polymerase
MSAAIASPADQIAERRRNLLIEGILLFAVGYNLVLAVVNALAVSISPSMAYAAELLAYGGCFVVGFLTVERRKLAIVMAGIALIAVVGFFRFLATMAVDPKFFRDAIIPFAFVLLGAAYTGSAPKLFLRMAVIIAIIAAFELAFPNVYGDVVNPKSYFVNTRGASEDSFWNEDSNLFVSATRPGERNFLPGSALPRASSIFIEPVTMGNYIIFFCATLLTFWRSYGPKRIAMAIVTVLFLVVASDGRLAAGTCVLMLLMAPFLRKLDQRFAGLIFLLVILSAWVLVWVTRTTQYEDTTLGRIFFTVDSITHLSAASWLGLDMQSAYRYFDSGISYFIASQSILIVLAFVLAYSFVLWMPSSNGQLFKNLFIFAFALSLLVSNGYFSVKTGALWWFACGYLWQWKARPLGLEDESPSRVPEVGRHVGLTGAS